MGQRATTALIAADDVAVARFIEGSAPIRRIPAPARGGGRPVDLRAGAWPRPVEPELVQPVGPGCRLRSAFARGPLGAHRVSGPLARHHHDRPVHLHPRAALVLIHELGHFVTARLAGVRVLEFGIGFPPRAKVLRTRGETALHAELAPDRRLREARGRGRRRQPTTRERSPAQPAVTPPDPRRGRRDERGGRIRDLHRDRLAPTRRRRALRHRRGRSPAAAAGIVPGESHPQPERWTAGRVLRPELQRPRPTPASSTPGRRSRWARSSRRTTKVVPGDRHVATRERRSTHRPLGRRGSADVRT